MSIIDQLLAETSPRDQQRVRDRMMLAARIADALVEKGWNQKQLAEKMGKGQSEISKWLSGTHNFTTDTLSDLSVVLGVKLLCVKEEPAIETKEVIRYQQLFVSTSRQHPSGEIVMWGAFQHSLLQTQPNG